jgi:amidohydrolase
VNAVPLEARATADETDELVRLRRDFHRHPELGYQETRTAGIVAERMKELGYDVVERVAETGVLATRGEGRPSLLLRADMDALPIQEANDVEYKSRNDGVMHACGHDGHTAIALLAAGRLARADFPGQVRFAFQPAEEGGQGADRMIEEGLLTGVDAAIGLHLWNDVPVGKVIVSPGPMMAAADVFTLDVHGSGGHAAKPQVCVDPIVAAADIVQRFQSIVSRGVDPFEGAVVSVTTMHGGSAFNVIPDRVRMEGTVRTFSAKTRAEVHRRMHEIVGDRGELEITGVTQALVNDPGVSEIVREAAGGIVGPENVIGRWQTMAGEDFASVLAAVPGCFFGVGAQPTPPTGGHHNPTFDIDERALSLGLEIMTRAARLFLSRGAE